LTRIDLDSPLLTALADGLIQVDATDRITFCTGRLGLSALPAERAARFLDLVSADRAVDMFRDMRVSVRNDVLALALPETREEIERAATLAAADDFIRALPQGYDSILHENGNNLSGGQRQRLALARALLLDPAILILDDPTAAVDTETESEILAGLDSAMAGRTCFIIAHRLGAVRYAERIVVLEHGRIAAIGTHEVLAAAPGYYREALLAQEKGGAA
jgi:ABC-type multidrug transport system fused ATPase/permease subunit